MQALALSHGASLGGLDSKRPPMRSFFYRALIDINTYRYRHTAFALRPGAQMDHRPPESCVYRRAPMYVDCWTDGHPALLVTLGPL